MKRIVLKLDINDAKEKQKAMKVVSSLPGIDSIGIDMKEKKMTVVGSVDPVSIVMKLRKSCLTDILSVGPVKEEEEEEEPNKEEEAIEEETKEEKQKEEEEEVEVEADKEVVPDDQQMAVELVNPYKIYYDPYNATQCHYVPSAQESCTIL